MERLYEERLADVRMEERILVLGDVVRFLRDKQSRDWKLYECIDELQGWKDMLANEQAQDKAGGVNV